MARPTRSRKQSARRSLTQRQFDSLLSDISNQMVPTIVRHLVVEEILRQHSALPALDKLVRAGSDRDTILELLAWMRENAPRLDSWPGLTGFKRRAFYGAVRRIRKCASVIEKINSGQLMQFWLSTHPKDADYRLLPRELLLFAKTLELCTRSVRPKKRLALNAVKRHLVRHVLHRTGTYRDQQVADLIGAALDRQYDEVAHRMWRLKHFAEARARN